MLFLVDCAVFVDCIVFGRFCCFLSIVLFLVDLLFLSIVLFLVDCAVFVEGVFCRMCCSMYCLCVNVYCTVLLPHGVYPTAVKYIISKSITTQLPVSFIYCLESLVFRFVLKSSSIYKEVSSYVQRLLVKE